MIVSLPYPTVFALVGLSWACKESLFSFTLRLCPKEEMAYHIVFDSWPESFKQNLIFFQT